MAKGMYVGIPEYNNYCYIVDGNTNRYTLRFNENDSDPIMCEKVWIYTEPFLDTEGYESSIFTPPEFTDITLRQAFKTAYDAGCYTLFIQSATFKSNFGSEYDNVLYKCTFLEAYDPEYTFDAIEQVIVSEQSKEDKARKVSKAYLGIGGKARKITKGYVGDSNGKARLFFSSGPKIVSWATGSDQDVAAMIQAAHNGEIKLADYWNIGDTRTVNLSEGTNSAGTAIPAQTVELVLAHKPTSTSYYGGGEFIINQKNCLTVANYMNSSDTNSGSFAGSAMASFLNNSSTGYLKMLPTWLRNVLLDAKVITAQTYNGTTNQKSTHKVFLPAAKEIFGGTATSAGNATSHSNLTEFNALEQWKWFKTSANRIKKGYSSNNWWWERSSRYDKSDSFCRVNADGTAGRCIASPSGGVAPAMLI